jgi:hypothetical protein
MPLALTDRQLKKVTVAASLIAPPLRDDFLRAIAAVTRDLPALSEAQLTAVLRETLGQRGVAAGREALAINRR